MNEQLSADLSEILARIKALGVENAHYTKMSFETIFNKWKEEFYGQYRPEMRAARERREIGLPGVYIPGIMG